MSDRVLDASAWIDANGVVDANAVDLLQAALGTPGDWGAFTVRREGSGKVVVGPISTLVLPDEAAEVAFQFELEERAGDEADGARPASAGPTPR